jgi:hypothetical protein
VKNKCAALEKNGGNGALSLSLKQKLARKGIIGYGKSFGRADLPWLALDYLLVKNSWKLREAN